MEFTVLLPIYGKESSKNLLDCLNSIRAQSLLPREILIIEDGPIGKNLKNIYDLFHKDLHLRIISLPENRGLANALNFGLDFINTEWAFRVDSDDLIHKNRFLSQVRYLLANECDVLGSQIYEFTTEPKLKLNSIRNVPLSTKQISKFIMHRNPMNHMTVCFKVSAVKAVGGYPKVKFKEDYALWIKLVGANYKLLNMPDCHVYARVNNDMLSRRSNLSAIFSEFKIQRYLIHYLKKPIYLAIIDLIIRVTLLSLPNKILNFIYKKFLRSRIKAEYKSELNEITKIINV